MAVTNMDSRKADRRFGRTVLGFVAVGFAAVMFAGISAALVMARGQAVSGWIEHTYQVERQVMAIRLSLEEMRSARRGAVMGLRHDSGLSYRDSAKGLFDRIGAVERLTTDNPLQQRNVARLNMLARRLDRLFQASIERGAINDGASEVARQNIARHVQRLSEAMLLEERRLLVERQREQRESVWAFYVIIALTGVLLAIVGAGSIWVIRRYTRELNISRDALQRLNEDLEGAVAERTIDLQRANEEIQRFAYIVSHDLRSPLVNVMGFTAELDAAIKPLSALIDAAEADHPHLVTAEAKEAVRSDLPEAVGFIRTSTQKMDRLINAILRLSREGRRSITLEPLDMTALAQSVVDGLRHRIDELGVDVRIDAPLPVIVSDRLAVEQIVSNLVENAVKYLDTDRPGLIQISGHRHGARAIIDVADNGRGIDQRDHERVFDLFRRSGVQDRPGEGIGLAHVRTLAYRLGGTISVDSELGKGATFKINLPMAYAGEKGTEQ